MDTICVECGEARQTLYTFDGCSGPTCLACIDGLRAYSADHLSADELRGPCGCVCAPCEHAIRMID